VQTYNVVEALSHVLLNDRSIGCREAAISALANLTLSIDLRTEIFERGAGEALLSVIIDCVDAEGLNEANRKLFLSALKALRNLAKDETNQVPKFFTH
jgi:hypothetical protein